MPAIWPGFQSDWFTLVGLEPFHRSAQPIRAAIEQDEAEGAGFIGHGILGEARGQLREFHADVGDQAATRVDYAAIDARPRILRGQRNQQQNGG